MFVAYLRGIETIPPVDERDGVARFVAYLRGIETDMPAAG